MRNRLLWHPESDSYIIGDEEAIMWEPLLVDVTDCADHEMNATMEGLDIDSLTREEYQKEDDDQLSAGLFRGSMSAAIIGGLSKWARKPADLYPTPPDCVYSLLPVIEDILPQGSRILEPACANGQMSNALEQYGHEVDSYDLRPDCGFGVGGVDFLDRDNGVFDDKEYDAVWTNPPFVIADEFIRRSHELAPVVIMLLKSQYFHAAKRKKLWNDFPPSRIYALTWRPSFLEAERGKSPLMDCMWAVWEKDHKGPCVYSQLTRLMSCPITDSSYGGL